MTFIIKKINHNTVLVEDGGQEKVVMGKGIGFRAVPNRKFDMDTADKVFTLDLEEKRNRFKRTQAGRSHIIKQYI